MPRSAGQVRQHCGPAARGEVGQEAFAEQVGGLAGGPAVQAGHRGVLADEGVFQRRHALHHAYVRVAAAPEGRALRLLVGGEALDHPGGREGVREEERGAAQHVGSAASRPDRRACGAYSVAHALPPS